MATSNPNLNSSEDVRKELLRLNNKRNQLEQEIITYQEILDSQNIGVNEPLVDAEGFPRNDIDVYQIRIARNKLSTLHTDIQNLMKQIEQLLHRFHELNPRESDLPIR